MRPRSAAAFRCKGCVHCCKCALVQQLPKVLRGRGRRPPHCWPQLRARVRAAFFAAALRTVFFAARVLAAFFAAALREAAVPAFLTAVFFAAVLRAGAFFAAAFLAVAFFAGAFFAAVVLVVAFFVADFLAGAFLAAFLLVAFLVPLRALPARLPPPSCLFTVAQAMRSAVPSLAPRSRSLSSIVLGLALLFLGICGFVTTGHDSSPVVVVRPAGAAWVHAPIGGWRRLPGRPWRLLLRRCRHRCRPVPPSAAPGHRHRWRWPSGAPTPG